MKWFDKWFVKKSKWAWDNKHLLDDNEVHYDHKITGSALEDDPHELNDGLRITLKRVIGGTLVTFKTFDKKLDRYESRTYIITTDQDFNAELAKTITLESMR